MGSSTAINEGHEVFRNFSPPNPENEDGRIQGAPQGSETTGPALAGPTNSI